MLNILTGLKVLIFFFCNHASKYTILEHFSPQKSFLKKIISMSYEDKGRVVDVRYLDFIKPFSTFCPSILIGEMWNG